MLHSPRTSLGLLLLCAATAACAPRAPGSRAPVPAAAAAADTATLQDTLLCLVDPASPAGLVTVPAKRVIATGEILHPDAQRAGRGAPAAVGAPSTYAGAHPWFIQHAPIRFAGHEFRPYGVQRLIQAGQVARAGEVAGVLAFVDPRDEALPELLYLPVAPGCVFQPYVRVDRIRQIRGE